MAVQKRNDEMVELLSADFQRRYEPNFAWVNALSACSLLPGLRGFWPMSSANEAGNAYDLSGQGRILTYTGNPAYTAAGLAPYIELDGVGDYLYRADEAGLDILGTETTVKTPGLTLGGWFYFDNAARNDGMLGKWNDNGVNQRSYLLYKSATPDYRALISTNGIASVSVTSSVTPAASGWIFSAMRFTPSTELAIWVNATKDTNVVGIPASLFNSTAQFIAGAYNNGAAANCDGRASLCWLCAAALPDVTIWALYEHTRSLFGV